MSTGPFVAKNGVKIESLKGVSQPIKIDSNGLIVTGLTFTDLNSTAHTHLWTNITNTPSTISGYGITDAYTITQIDLSISGITNSLTAHTSLTGSTNPHLTSFYDLTSTAHTHDERYVNIDGDTMTGNLIAPMMSASTFEGNLNWNYVTNRVNTLSGYGIYDAYTSGQTDYKYQKLMRIIDVTGVTSYTGQTGFIYYLNTEFNDVDFYIPDSTINNRDERIIIFKENSTNDNVVTVRTIGGQTIGEQLTQLISKDKHGIEIISCFDDDWDILNDNRSNPRIVYVNVNSSEFTDIKSAVDYVNTYSTFPTSIYICEGEYYVDETITITNSNLVSIFGDGYFETIIHPTSNLTGKTMFEIQSGTLMKNLLIDCSNLGSGATSYVDTVGSIAIRYINNIKIYIDNIKIQYANVGLSMICGGTVKTSNCFILYCGSYGVYIDKGTFMSNDNMYLRYNKGTSIFLTNGTGDPINQNVLFRNCQILCDIDNIMGLGVHTEINTKIQFDNCIFQFLENGVEAHDTSKIIINNSYFNDINNLYFNQTDSTALLIVNNTIGKLNTTNINISNSTNAHLDVIDNSTYNKIIGDGVNNTTPLFDINIGMDSKNPTFEYNLWGNSVGLMYRNKDDVTLGTSFFASVAHNRDSYNYVATYGTNAHSTVQTLNLTSYEANYLPPAIEYDKFKTWSLIKQATAHNLFLRYSIGLSAQTNFTFTKTGDFYIPKDLYISGLTSANNGNILTWNVDDKIIDSGTKVSDILYSAHTHSNKSNLDTIDQNLSTTSNVNFNQVTLNTLSIDTGLTIRSGSGNTLLLRNGTDSNYANMIVNNLTVLGTQTVNQQSTISTSGNTIFLLSGQTTPTQNAYIEIVRGSGYTDAVVMWDELNKLWKAGYLGSERQLAYDGDVVHLTGNESINGIKTFNDKIVVGTGVTTTRPLQVNSIANLQGTCFDPNAGKGLLVASNSGRSYFMGKGSSAINLGSVDSSGNLIDYWTVSNFTDGTFSLKYGSSYFVYDNTTKLTVTKHGLLDVNSAATNVIFPKYENSGVSFNDLENNSILKIDTQYKSLSVNNVVNTYYPLVVDSLVLNISEILYTTGSSVYVNTSNNAFINIKPDAKIIANAQTRYVVNKIDNNNIEVDVAVDWSAGHSFVYKNASYIVAEGSTSDAKGFYMTEAGNLRWEMYNWHDEDGEFLGFWSEKSKRDVLVVSQSGRFGFNSPTVYTGQKSSPDNVSIFPQCLDAVYYYDGTGYTDNTVLAKSSSASTFIFLTRTTDYTYVGKYCNFATILLYTYNSLTGTSLNFEYYNGASWITLTNLTHSLIDNTNGLSIPGGVSFDKYSLTNWTPTTINGSNLYWIRISATSITTTSYMKVVSNNAINRIGVYNSNADTTPRFQVDPFGKTSIGDSLTYSRLRVGVSSNVGRSLGIIDENASMRLWKFADKTTDSDTLLEMIKGNSETLSNNIWWDIRLENNDGKYNEEGLIIRDVNTNYYKFIFGKNTNIMPLQVTVTGNTNYTGFLIDVNKITENGSNNNINVLNITKSVTGNTNITGITIGSGLNIGLLSNSKVLIDNTSLTYAFQVIGNTNLTNLNVTTLTATTLYSSNEINSSLISTNNLNVTQNITATTFYGNIVGTNGSITNLNSSVITGTTIYSGAITNSGAITVRGLSTLNTLTLQSGSTTVFGIYTTTGLTENSNSYLATQSAVKTYVDSQNYMTFSASRAANLNAAQDLRYGDSVPTNTSPFVVPFNCTLDSMSISSDATASATWTGTTYVNDVEVARVAVNNSYYAYRNTFSVSLNAGDRIRLRFESGSGNRPSISVFLKKR